MASRFPVRPSRQLVGCFVSALLLCLVVAEGAAGVGIEDPSLVLSQPALIRPAVGERVVDPVFGTTLRRLTTRTGPGGWASHVYSQLQAVSPDGLFLLLIEDDAYVVRRIEDLALQTALETSSWNSPRWLPSAPHSIVHYDGNGDDDVTVQVTDATTGVTADLLTLPAQYERIRVNQSFDELSRDGRWMAGMLASSSGGNVLFALDVVSRTLGATISVDALYAGPCAPDPQWGAVEPDWVGVSPLGRYLVVQWARDGTARCSGLETFAIATGAFAGRVYDGHQHGDLGIMPDGTTEFFMTFELYHPSGELSLGTRTLPGTATASAPTYVQVLDWGNGAHISCRGPAGVCLVTASSDLSNGRSAFEGELFLQHVDGRVERIAHHRSSECGYWVQPRATLSVDGRRVVFASDWGTASCAPSNDNLGRGEVYVVELEETGIEAGVCGDGVEDVGEACDDGNVNAGDGCSEVCEREGVAGELLVWRRIGEGQSLARFRVRSLDSAIGLAAEVDPHGSGGTLLLRSADGSLDVELPLPPEGWQAVAPGIWRYSDLDRVRGPVRRVVLRPGLLALSAIGGGELLSPFATHPGDVEVALAIDGRYHCLRFGGETTFRSGRGLRAWSAPPAESCW
jgi:cysteine-rich repeat protein